MNILQHHFFHKFLGKIIFCKNKLVIGYKLQNNITNCLFCCTTDDITNEKGCDSWLFNLTWSLLFMSRVLFSGHKLHTRGWGEMKMKGQPNRDLNPVPPSQWKNHATNWANEAGL